MRLNRNLGVFSFPCHSIPSRPKQPTDLSKHSIQAGRVNLGSSQAQHPNNDYRHRVGDRVGGSALGAKH